MKKARERLDLLLVERGICETKEIARSVIMAGEVSVNGETATKSGEPVPCDCVIEVKKRFPYVGRGALKLIEALDHFKIDPGGKTAIDIGASTGGFTQVLLERGAVKVYAVDSGTNQLDWRLRINPRVVVMENTNARYLTREMLGDLPQIAVIDVSFISITKLLKAVKDILEGDYVIIALIKPQFELERENVGPGGIADPAKRMDAVKKVAAFAGSIGLKAEEPVESPIKGQRSGNVEYLVAFRENGVITKKVVKWLIRL